MQTREEKQEQREAIERFVASIIDLEWVSDDIQVLFKMKKAERTALVQKLEDQIHELWQLFGEFGEIIEKPLKLK